MGQIVGSRKGQTTRSLQEKEKEIKALLRTWIGEYEHLILCLYVCTNSKQIYLRKSALPNLHKLNHSLPAGY